MTVPCAGARTPRRNLPTDDAGVVLRQGQLGLLGELPSMARLGQSPDDVVLRIRPRAWILGPYILEGFDDRRNLAMLPTNQRRSRLRGDRVHEFAFVTFSVVRVDCYAQLLGQRLNRLAGPCAIAVVIGASCED